MNRLGPGHIFTVILLLTATALALLGAAASLRGSSAAPSPPTSQSATIAIQPDHAEAPITRAEARSIAKTVGKRLRKPASKKAPSSPKRRRSTPTVPLTPSYDGYMAPNGAGFPKNQYVAPYTRKDGTSVGGYYRNSPSDSLPTCSYTRC